MRTQVLPDRQLATAWLQRFEPGSSRPQTFSLEKTPFVIGRTDDCDCPINNTRISRRHAEILLEAGGYRLHDLGSTNGTFLNGQRIDSAFLQDGDLLLIADSELSFHIPSPAVTGTMATQVMSDSGSDTLDDYDQAGLEVVRTLRSLQEVLLHRAIRHHFSPIVDLATQKVLGQEAIDHTLDSFKSKSIEGQFAAIQESRLLSRLYHLHRLMAVQQVGRCAGQEQLFLRVHEAELTSQELPAQLALMQRQAGQHPLVLQVPVLDTLQHPELEDFVCELQTQNLTFAYDGFLGGAPQLLSIEATNPAYIKLAPAMVHGIDRSRPRQQQMRHLAEASHKKNIPLIATGFHSQQEVQVCLDLGCELGQGDLFG